MIPRRHHTPSPLPQTTKQRTPHAHPNPQNLPQITQNSNFTLSALEPSIAVPTCVTRHAPRANRALARSQLRWLSCFRRKERLSLRYRTSPDTGHFCGQAANEFYYLRLARKFYIGYHYLTSFCHWATQQRETPYCQSHSSFHCCRQSQFQESGKLS